MSAAKEREDRKGERLRKTNGRRREGHGGKRKDEDEKREQQLLQVAIRQYNIPFSFASFKLICSLGLLTTL